MTVDIDRNELSLGVVGAGTMGRGIAQVAAERGITTLLFDAKPGAASDALKFIARMIDRQAEKGTLSAETAAAAKARVREASSVEEVAAADIVIEAVVEDLAVKRQLFAALEAAARPETILLTNTSSLPVTAIASVCRRRERVAGMHFFNPVPLMKLVEVIPGLATAADVTRGLVRLARRMGREPVVSTDSPGFIVNHVGRAYAPEAARLVAERIADYEEIDRVMTGAPGFRLGPFALLDLIGSDISVGVMESIWAQYFAEPMYAPNPELKLRVLGGLYGQKSGEGWYAYRDGRRSEPPIAPTPDARPKSVWVMPSTEPQMAAELTAYLATTGCPIDTSAHPGAESLILLTPLGWDLTTAACDLEFDARRMAGVDMLFGLNGPRTVMVTPAIDPAMRDAAHGLMGVDGTPVVVINDSPGFIAQRIVAHIVNVACQVAARGIATPQDIDKGTKLGLGYPLGPLEWGDKLGPGLILHILERLEAFYRDPRYRPSPWLKRRAMLGLSLLTPDGRTMS
ncbi:MAG: 3-hydroxyacyl-CoA dehydrogenase [Hyphomicrobiaceae bacterium]